VLLTLLECYSLASNIDVFKFISSAETYLLNCISDEGSWSAVNFIYPRINDPYKSKTITTSFVVRALYAANKIVKKTI